MTIKTLNTFYFLEKNNVDLGVNIADDLEDLKKNLDMYKVKVSSTSSTTIT